MRTADPQGLNHQEILKKSMLAAIHFGDHPMFLNQFHIVACVKKTESPLINHRHIMVTWLHGDYISHNGSYYGCCGTIVVNFPAFF